MRLGSLSRSAGRVPWGTRVLAPACRPVRQNPLASHTAPLLRHASTAFAEQVDNVSAKIGQLSEKKGEWAVLPVAAKTKLLGEILEIFSTLDHEAWARDSLQAQGYDAVQPDVLLGTEMIMNTRIISADLENLVDVFATLRDTGAPPTVPIREGVGGRLVASVFPRLMSDTRGPNL